MDQISEHIYSSNKKIHSYDQMRKNIDNLGSKKCENNNNSTYQLRQLKNSLLISIVDTTENYLPNVDSKIRHGKSTYIFIKSSSTLFSCSIFAMYNRVNRAKKQRLVLNLYLPWINTSIFPQRHYENIFSEILVNELYYWIEN